MEEGLLLLQHERRGGRVVRRARVLARLPRWLRRLVRYQCVVLRGAPVCGSTGNLMLLELY